MKLGIMQPYFFPYLGYWQLMNAVDVYVIYDDVNYIKNGWINRNNILLNGKKHLITLPLDKASSFLTINNICYTSNNLVIAKLLKTIYQSYKKAPFFNDVYPIIESTFSEKTCFVSKLLERQFSLVNQYLGIKTKILLSSNLKKDNNLKGQEKVINICKLLNATEYYNTESGKNLYSKEIFCNSGIKLHFLKPKDISYMQFKNIFVPNLSIIDVMMFNSKEKIMSFMNEYELS